MSLKDPTKNIKRCEYVCTYSSLLFNSFSSRQIITFSLFAVFFSSSLSLGLFWHFLILILQIIQAQSIGNPFAVNALFCSFFFIKNIIYIYERLISVLLVFIKKKCCLATCDSFS